MFYSTVRYLLVIKFIGWSLKALLINHIPQNWPFLPPPPQCTRFGKNFDWLYQETYVTKMLAPLPFEKIQYALNQKMWLITIHFLKCTKLLGLGGRFPMQWIHLLIHVQSNSKICKLLTFHENFVHSIWILAKSQTQKI